jgi:hypothetical protein
MKLMKFMKHLYSADRSANILDCLHAESRVIPSLALAAGPRPTWWPGKLTGQIQMPHDRTFPACGGGRAPEERTLKIYLEAVGAA